MPSKDEMLSCLEELNLTAYGSGDVPYLTIEVACTPTQLTDAGDLAAIDQLAA